MTMYVLVRIEDMGDTFTVDPCGVYSDPNDALDWIDRLEAISQSPHVIFDALEFEIDEEPTVFGWMDEKRQQLVDATDRTLQNLIQKGMIEQFIDEEGRFCYELTKKGKTMMKGIPGQIIQKYIDDKDKEKQ